LIVHTIWLGTEIPVRYQQNIRIHRDLNPDCYFMHWSDRDAENLLAECKLLDLYNTLSFINRFNLVKYTILDKFGGVYTDLDITWKVSFTRIMGEHGFGNVDLILTHSDYSDFYLDHQQRKLLDDPFVIAKEGVMNRCLDYRLNRLELRIDPETKEIHKAEPIGPFLLSEWAYRTGVKMSVFSQHRNLDWNGYYGNHDQFGLWN
jgi:hypothetical protein